MNRINFWQHQVNAPLVAGFPNKKYNSIQFYDKIGSNEKKQGQKTDILFDANCKKLNVKNGSSKVFTNCQRWVSFLGWVL